MTRYELMELLQEDYEEVLLADGFEDAFVGIASRCASKDVAVYDLDRAVEVMVSRDGITHEEAMEYISFKVLGAYVGERTPWFITWKP